MFHKVGALFSQEQINMRKRRHSDADAAENGPKEISIYCPVNPQVKIVDLDESERNRDECLVLNLAAPDVSTKLVIFCSAAGAGRSE